MACASTQNRPTVYAPEDMPEICRDLDFNTIGEDLKKQCGVLTRNYKAYRNIPEHRNLLLPKGAQIIKKGLELELRLQNTLPEVLPKELVKSIPFGERHRRSFIKTEFDYCEFFPNNAATRIRVFSLKIPTDSGSVFEVCYGIQSKQTTALRNSGYASRLEALPCLEFYKLKEMAQSNTQGLPANDTAYDDQ